MRTIQSMNITRLAWCSLKLRMSPDEQALPAPGFATHNTIEEIFLCGIFAALDWLYGDCHQECSNIDKLGNTHTSDQSECDKEFLMYIYSGSMIIQTSLAIMGIAKTWCDLSGNLYICCANAAQNCYYTHKMNLITESHASMGWLLTIISLIYSLMTGCSQVRPPFWHFCPHWRILREENVWENVI